MSRFNPRGFRVFLEARNIATAPLMIRYVRRCYKHKARTPDDVDDVFPHLSVSTRRYYKHAMRRYLEFLEAT